MSLERRLIEVEIEVAEAARSARLVVNGESLGAVGSRRTVAVEWPRNGLQIELDDPRFEPIVERIPPAALSERLNVAIGESRLVPKGGR